MNEDIKVFQFSRKRGSGSLTSSSQASPAQRHWVSERVVNKKGVDCDDGQKPLIGDVGLWELLFFEDHLSKKKYQRVTSSCRVRE
jgi:hypothetical protein